MQEGIRMLQYICLTILLLSNVISGVREVPNPNANPTNPGLRKSSYPYISGDTFRSICNHIYDETDVPFNPTSVRAGDLVFVRIDVLGRFFDTYHPQIGAPYILLTFNEDQSIPREFSSYLDDEKIIAWFADHTDRRHPKLHSVPIGFPNYFWAHGKTEIINRCIQNVPSWENRDGFKIYVNFRIHTCPRERTEAWLYFKEKSFSVVATDRSFGDYLNDIKRCKFVVSPPGNALDCHRSWEALIMGAIPIMKHSPIDHLFDDLPVIFVDNWEIITEDFLKEQYQKLKEQTFNYKKLYADYWLDQIYKIQREFLATHK